MISDTAKSAVLRTLAFHQAWNHEPTLPELIQTLDCRYESAPSRDEVLLALENPVWARRAAPLSDCDLFQTRKLRRARKVAHWLSRLGGVRFVALCNTAALGIARDEADLDFFVITRAGAVWTSRFLAAGSIRLLRLAPRPGHERDSVCLSYFVADSSLDLSSHMLADDDPYFRYWFLSLLPLYNDGISEALWNANAKIRARHPFAAKWLAPPDLQASMHFFPYGKKCAVSRIKLPACRVFESLAKSVQMRAFPFVIKDRMNKDTTVIVNDYTLKFHVNDGRERIRDKYLEICREKGIAG